MDYYEEGLDTIETLEKHNISYCCAGKSIRGKNQGIECKGA